MSTKTKGKTTEPKGAKERAQAIKTILGKVEARMQSETVKLTLGDYIRLIQLSREMEEQPSEMKVTWIEEPENIDET